MEDIWKNRTHPQFDPRSMRILLTAAQLKALPFKEVTLDELADGPMCTMEYNPTHYYPKGLHPRKRERGHDLQYRYLLAVSKPVEPQKEDYGKQKI